MRQKFLIYLVLTIIFLAGVFLVYAERSGLISIFADVPNVPGTVIVDSRVDLQKGLIESNNLKLTDAGLALENSSQNGECQFDVGSPQVKEFFRFQSIKKVDIGNAQVSVKFASSLDGVSFSDYSAAFRLDPSATVPDSIDLTQILPETTRFIRISCSLAGEEALFQGFSLNFEALNLPSVASGPLSFGLEPIAGQAPLQISTTKPAELSGCNWDFGDGTIVAAENLTTNHEYTNSGTYGVSLNCGDQTGTRQVTVTKEPFSQVRVATTQSSYTTGDQVSFSLINDGPAPVSLPNATPYVVLNATTNEIIYSPIGVEQLSTLKEDDQQDWKWDLINNDGDPVKPGVYVIRVSYNIENSNQSFDRVINITNPNDQLNSIGLTANPIQGQAPLTVNLNSEIPAIFDLGDGTYSKEKNFSHTYSLPGTYSISAHSIGALTTQVILATAGLVTNDLPQIPILINGYLAGSSDEIDVGNLSGKTETLIATNFLDLTTNTIVVLWIVATVFIFTFRPKRKK